MVRFARNQYNNLHPMPIFFLNLYCVTFTSIELSFPDLVLLHLVLSFIFKCTYQMETNDKSKRTNSKNKLEMSGVKENIEKVILVVKFEFVIWRWLCEFNTVFIVSYACILQYGCRCKMCISFRKRLFPLILFDTLELCIVFSHAKVIFM